MFMQHITKRPRQGQSNLPALWTMVFLCFTGCSGAEFSGADPIDGTQLDGASEPDSAIDSGASGSASGSDAYVASDTGNPSPDAVNDSGYPGDKDDAPSNDCPPGQTVTRCGDPRVGNPCPVNSTITLICDCNNAVCYPQVTFTCKCDS